MKKMLVSLLVLAMVAPAMAVVTIDVEDNADGTATITMNTGGDMVRGVALKVTCTEGASLVDLSYTANAEFNTFIDFLSVNSGTVFAGDTPDPANDSPTPHPFAVAGTSAGEAVAGATTFVVSMGVLDAAGNQDGYSSTVAEDLITIKTGEGDVCVSLDTVRGGVVGDVALTTNIDTTPDCVTVTVDDPDCITASHEDYTDWVSVGKPDSWCWERQCHGDADNATEPFGRSGSVWVGYNDINVLVASFQSPTPNLAADFNRRSEPFGRSGSVRVGYDDIAVLLNYFQSSSVPADCLSDDHVNP